MLKIGLDYQFTGNKVDGRRELRVARELQAQVFGLTVTVPEGFLSDGASTPTFVDNTLGFDPLNTVYIRAAVFHDYLYRHPTLYRWLADLVFLALILGEEQPLYKKLFFGIIMFTAVRFCGKKHYDRHNS